MNAERIAYLKDKMQSWPGEMALTSEDIADLLAILDGLTRLAKDRDAWKKRAMTTLPELLELRAYKVAAEKAKKRKP